MKKLVLLLNLVFLLIASNSYSDDFVRKTTWVTSDLITASKLNADPDETARVLGTSGNGLISNGNIKSTAAIVESKVLFSASAGHDHDNISSNDLADSSVASAQITDGTIVNADVNASADIATSKIDFSGEVDLTGTFKIDGTTVTSSATELNLLTGVTGTVVTESTSLGGILSGTLPNPSLNASVRAGLYYEPDQTCVLALAGYNFDPATATTFKDSSLYGNDFTIAGTPPEGVGKVSKTCVDLEGADDTLSIADGNYGDFGDCNDITIELLLKQDVANETDYIVENASGIGTLIWQNDGKFGVNLNVGTGTAAFVSGSAYTSTADWYYVVMTYQSTDHTLRLFVDGVADGTDATKSGDVDTASGDIFYIGSSGGTTAWFNGKVDGFRILRRDMLVAEALSRYDSFK